jgi:hypothetical protein
MVMTDPYSSPIDYLDNEEMKVVIILKLISSILSFLGSLFIICTYLFMTIKVKCKKKRSHSTASQQNQNQSDDKSLKMGYGHDMIFCLAMSDFILSLSIFLKVGINPIPDASCIAQGVLMNFGEISSICWTSILALSIYLGTKSTEIKKISNTYYIFFFIYAYGMPLILTIGPLASQAIGPAGPWCWMYTKEYTNNAAWIWTLIIYIFNWLNISFNIFAVIKSIIYFKIRAFEIKEYDKNQANFLKNFTIMLKFFPIILIVCWIFPTINRIYIYATKHEDTFLYAMHAFSSCLMGFLNSLVYSYYYRQLLAVYCCGKKEKRLSSVEIDEHSKVKRPEDNLELGNNEKNMKKDEHVIRKVESRVTESEEFGEKPDV